MWYNRTMKKSTHEKKESKKVEKKEDKKYGKKK